MPVSEKIYKEKRIFPFFEGLIPKGWLLEIAAESWLSVSGIFEEVK